MDIIYEIRRWHLVQKQTITEISRDMGISRPTVRRHLATVEEPKYGVKVTILTALSSAKIVLSKPIKWKLLDADGWKVLDAD